ncbi:hypothetical protein HYV82_05875 [Candidatus Woesearchaeota archaeon]|nr:hypothetical protein [Candidatus Woesearchaeota archaeon]
MMNKLFMEIMSFYSPIALSLPGMRAQGIKAYAKAQRGKIADLVTEADLYMQEKLKQLAQRQGWQFWGEEGSDNREQYDESMAYLLITDPIEGTNNFVAGKDDQWGSVVALVDIRKKEPVIGIVAHPSKRLFYTAIKGSGAFIYYYDEQARLLRKEKMCQKPEFEEFTYNNSPHFDTKLQKQVENFLRLGKTEDRKTSNLPEASMKPVIIHGKRFVAPQSGALEAVRYRGTIYFHTSNEMAAVFAILNELGGKVTDGYGKPWHLGINSLIAARNKTDYDFLKNLQTFL